MLALGREDDREQPTSSAAPVRPLCLPASQEKPGRPSRGRLALTDSPT